MELCHGGRCYNRWPYGQTAFTLAAWPGSGGVYAYQSKCPNDQSLIAVRGRRLGSGADPQPPRWDRHGIPNIGSCLRCNLQIEGGPVGGEGGARERTLDDKQAYDLFDRACKQQFAKGFKLYKLYSRAAAFSQRTPRKQ